MSKRSHSEVSEESMAEMSEKQDLDDSLITDCLAGTVSCGIKDLAEDVRGRGGIIQRLEEVEAQMADITNDYCELRGDNITMKQQINLLKATVIKKDKEIDDLKKSMTEQKVRGMRKNILLHNIQETKGENCIAIVQLFLEKSTSLHKDEIPYFEFEAVHRLGVQKGEHSRPIFIRCLYMQDKERIMQSLIRYRKEENNKTAFMSNHLPPEVLSKRSINQHLLTKMKLNAGTQDIKVKIDVDKMYVNNELIKPKVIKPTTDEVLNIDKSVIENGNQLPSGVSKQVFERGSSFVAQVFKTTNLKQVREAYLHVLSDPSRAKATHNIMAYQLGDDAGWVDDEEFGAGRFLSTFMAKREMLKNITVVVTRNYGGTHLGTRRFELMRNVTEEAIKKLPM